MISLYLRKNEVLDMVFYEGTGREHEECYQTFNKFVRNSKFCKSDGVFKELPAKIHQVFGYCHPKAPESSANVVHPFL